MFSIDSSLRELKRQHFVAKMFLYICQRHFFRRILFHQNVLNLWSVNIIFISKRFFSFLNLTGRFFPSLLLFFIDQVIPAEAAKALLAACKSGNFDLANKEVSNIIAEGYPVSQMLTQVRSLFCSYLINQSFHLTNLL